jgi:hypothetical protein
MVAHTCNPSNQGSKFETQLGLHSKTLSEKSWAQVAHAYNPTYSGDSNQEDHSLKPAQANSSQDPILKNPSPNRAGRVTQVVECLPSKRETLSSHHSATKIRKKRKRSSCYPFPINQCRAPVMHACNPSIQKTEIRKIMVWSQPRQIVPKILSQKKPFTKKSWWSGSRCRPWIQTPILQNKKGKN